MKTLKTLLITATLIITSLTTTAQDSTNDATWKETIEFIKKNKDYIIVGNVGDEYFTYVDQSLEWRRTSFILENNRRLSMRFTPNKKKDRFCGWEPRVNYIEYTIPLDKLSYASDYYYTILKTTGNDIDVELVLPEKRGDTCFTKEKSFKKIDKIEFRIEDNEMRPRLFSAFEHLAYLAKEKREAARKASGDKF